MQRSFLVGLLVGAAIGGGGVYLGLTRPWAGGGAEADAAPDAGAEPAERERPARRPRGKRRRSPAGEPGEPTLTEADRALRWRGAELELPAREVDFGQEGGGRPLGAGEINEVIKRRSQPVIDCIASARGEAPLRAAVTLELLVDGSGTVTRSRVRAPAYLFDHGLGPCIDRAARQLRFPATGAATIVTAPYDLF